MAEKRVKRPKLERDRPNRSWSTLFGTAPGREAPPPAAPASAMPGAPERAALTDAVQMGYRVIDDYLKQSQQVAQSFAPGSWGGAPAGSPEDMQQMAQRVMQYGWDFAGMWMEMWNRMGGAAAFRPPGVSPDVRPPATGAEPGRASPQSSAASSEAMTISVESALTTTTSVELRPGPPGELVIHALRADGHQAPPIRDVSIERTQDGRLQVRVKVAGDQAPGEYRALIVEAASNLPRGALSVRVHPKQA